MVSNEMVSNEMVSNETVSNGIKSNDIASVLGPVELDQLFADGRLATNH
jgi:hypothetical protein